MEPRRHKARFQTPDGTGLCASLAKVLSVETEAWEARRSE